jgi:protein-S-isoprenylcysteine O-methyltransferase Ste14
MSIFGVGPSLAVVGGITFLLVLVLQRVVGLSMRVDAGCLSGLQIAGLFWGAIGLWFWVDAAILVARSYRRHKLAKEGVYRYSRNPMYAAFIVFLIPAISFISGDLLILSVSVVMFLAFKALIRKEEAYLKREFGDEYEHYAKRVAQLIPFINV